MPLAGVGTVNCSTVQLSIKGGFDTNLHDVSKKIYENEMACAQVTAQAICLLNPFFKGLPGQAQFG